MFCFENDIFLNASVVRAIDILLAGIAAELFYNYIHFLHCTFYTGCVVGSDFF